LPVESDWQLLAAHAAASNSSHHERSDFGLASRRLTDHRSAQPWEWLALRVTTSVVLIDTSINVQHSTERSEVTHKLIAAGSVALLGAGSLLGATAANAFTVADCGATPAGGFIDHTDGHCQLGFPAGEYTWTTPANSSELWGLLIGGGGGASSDLSPSPDSGYAGGGGEVEFVDLTELDAGTELDILTGAGGLSTIDGSRAADGEPSVLTAGSQVWTVAGGVGNDDFSWSWGWCGAGLVGQGPSYFDDGLPEPADEFCGPGAPGYIPTEELDTPGIFSNVTFEIAPGGDVLLDGIGNQVEGSGADVFVDSLTQNATTDPKGDDGGIIFRWIPGDLASTGVDAAPLGIAAAGMLVAGGVGLAIARRARRSN
jgi:hypothetical protein